MEQGGPVLVEGPVEVDLGQGRTAVSDRFVVALCACRRSRSYPWCDTSHRRRPHQRRDGDRPEQPPEDGPAEHPPEGDRSEQREDARSELREEAGEERREDAGGERREDAPWEQRDEAGEERREDCRGDDDCGSRTPPARARSAPRRARSARRRARSAPRGAPNPSPSAATAPLPGTSTVGVEEEFLLVDEASGRTVPAAAEVLDEAGRGPALPDGGLLEPELLAGQVESASGVCDGLPALAEQLAAGRRLLADAARRTGRRLISTGTPVHESDPATLTPGDRFTAGERLTAGDRYEQIRDLYGGLLADYEACGCHVHVGVPDEETAVAVVNHLRPWLPSLVALSANSPFHAGRDTGYASWRMVLQSRFPGSGVPPYFSSAAAHRKQVGQLVECGTLADVRQSFWLARPSPAFPTVEFRAADAATTVDESVLQAALSRALVRTALTDLSEGREPVNVPEQVAAAALWSAARHGLDGPAVHPEQQRKVPAVDLLNELLDHVTSALEESGDLRFVRRQTRLLVHEGTGAQRQRAHASAAGGTEALVGRLAEETLRAPEAVRAHHPQPSSRDHPATPSSRDRPATPPSPDRPATTRRTP